ncbi:conserved hypothetical protein [Paraburkholderia unamae]|uniref:hypothetical protein n=1 Tax=Paraburkholderia unamae TaxID=219649 RepID=UPI000DC20C17|nr:hypothetical protein [Paraburkholderia unamae]RAR56642.1 hypothetical protein C7401_11883 [Paraburkholderia unamae]CAG9269851.1 conserved hypothetical protein [Paraburkholderia unamae]
MNTKHSKKMHIEAAASHHEHAAQHHREASRHFEEGRDFGHAAHQALMAHGHTLHAIDQAHEAGAHGSNTQPAAPPVASSTGSGVSGAEVAKYHAAAVELHMQAAQHMRHAVKIFDQDRSAVSHDAQLALSLALRALSHGNDAARLFVKLAASGAS